MTRLRSCLVFACLSLALLVAAPLSPNAQETGANQGDGFETLVQNLNQRSFNKKGQAIDALAASGNARVVGILQAMSDGLLFYRKSDKLVVIGVSAGNDYVLEAAASGEALGRVPKADVKKIVANNRLRRQITALLGGMMLFSDDPANRATAAETLIGKPDPAQIPRLETALAKETNSGVAAKLTQALNVAKLFSEEPAVRLEAVNALAGARTQDVRVLLDRVAQGDQDPGVAAAAAEAVSDIDDRLAMIEVGQNLAFGLSAGSILLLAAIGLAITFGVMGVINMAHGEMIMLGAYTTFTVQEIFRATLPPEAFGFYLVVAIPAAFLVAGAFGVAMERSIIRFLYGRPLETLLATWGVSLMLQQLVRSIYGATNREVANPQWMAGSVELFGGLEMTTNRVVIILFGLAVLLALAAVIRFSRFGLDMRAVTQNRQMASAMGIRTGWVDALTFGLGSGIAGVAGVALSQVTNVSPNLGQNYIVDSFMVVVFGGVGSLWGVFLGAMSLGVVNKFLEPFSGAVLAKILVLVFIILFIQRRPRGLFALKGRAFEN